MVEIIPRDFAKFLVRIGIVKMFDASIPGFGVKTAW
jgi:hypothetical protein